MTETIVSTALGGRMSGPAASPREEALAYWRALGAPVPRIAGALRMGEHAVTEALARLDDDRAGFAAPLSRQPWDLRTANELILYGLARDEGEQLVLIAGEGALTAGEVTTLVGRLWAGFEASGVRKGDRIAVDSSQRLETYLVALAALLSGAVLVRLGDAAGPKGLRAMVEAAPAAITFSARLDAIGDIDEAGLRVALDASGGDTDFPAFLSNCPEPPSNWMSVLPHVMPDDAAFIGFTSGSTGQPKAMRTSHEAVFRSTEIAQDVFGFDTDDVFCTATDFTALSAFRSLVTLPFLSGGRVVIPDAEARADPLALARLCARFGVTRLTTVPGVIAALNAADARFGREDLAALRTVLSGSGVLDGRAARAFRTRFSVPVVDYYGAREFATAACCDPDGERTMSAGGGDVRDCLVRVVDETGATAPPGETGEIVVHSDCMTLTDLPSICEGGPWSGWHFTGDLGRIVADGRLEIVGRTRDIIKTPDGGLVGPAEIEAALNALDWVTEAAAFAWSDADHVERVGAAIAPVAGLPLPADPAGEARRAVGAVLGAHKTPAHVLVVEDMPRLGRGKPDKIALRGMLDAQVRPH